MGTVNQAIGVVNDSIHMGIRETTSRQNAMISNQYDMISNQQTIMSQLVSIERKGGMGNPRPGTPLKPHQLNKLRERFGPNYDFCVNSLLRNLGCQGQNSGWRQPINEKLYYSGRNIRVILKWCPFYHHFCAISKKNLDKVSGGRDKTKEVVFVGYCDDGIPVVNYTDPANPNLSIFD